MIAANKTSRSSLARKNFPGAALFAACALVLLPIPFASAAPFTAGNLAVLRCGDGAQALANTGNSIFIDEYTPGGALVQSIAVPDNGTNALIISGSASSEGALMRSPDGHLLCFGGYATNRPFSSSLANSASTLVGRGVGLVDAFGNFTLAVTTASQFSANNIRGAATDGTNNFWGAGGTSGTYYFGFGAAAATIQNVSTSTRQLNIFNGNLYFSVGSSTTPRGVFGFTNAGLPSVATGATNLINTGNSSSPFAFAINTANTVAYIVDDNAPASSGGIQKWTNSGAAWSLAYIVNTNASRGLAVDWSGANPVLYTTTATNSIITVTDTNSTATATLLVRGTNTIAFRGLAFAPLPPPPTISAQPQSSTNECAGANASFSVTATPSPLTYQWYFGVSPISNATNNTLSVAASTGNAGNYNVVVSNGGGSVTSSVATLTIKDTIAPSITTPGNLSAFRTSSGGAAVTFSSSATDTCVGSVAAVCTPASGSTFPIGATTVTCVANDGNGNTNSASFTVTVTDALVPHLDNVAGDVTNALGSTTFINHGLVGVGHISASALDSFGETFGSMSGMQITGFTTNADGSYSGTLNVLPDRGYNLGAFYADYAARINQVGFTFRPYYGSTNIGGTTDLEKLNAQTNQFTFGAISGVRFTYFDPNTGSNSFTTGLDPGTNFATLFGKTMPYVTSYTGVPSPSSTATNTYTGINKLPLDSEALIIKPDGSGYVGDEYGEHIYYFNSGKQIIGAIVPPQAFLPHAPTNVPNYSSAITPLNGRRNNQGFEGVSLSPDRTRLFALQQSASVQDSDAANNQRAKNTRLLIYDVSGSPTPSSPIAEYALTLPIYKLNGNGGAADRTCAQSEIVALDNTRFLVLSRDGNGLGNAVTNPNVYKAILLVDTTVGSPLNIAGDAARNAESGKITTASGVLDPTITPLSWIETVNLLNTNQLAKFNVLWDSGTNQVSKLTMGEKWEGLALVSANDPANPNDYFLFVGNDNDFVTSAGQMRGPDGTIVSYNAFDGYPASRVPAPLDSANSENDTRLLAYRVTITPATAPAAPLQTTVITVTNRIYSPYSTALTAGTYVYVDADIAAGSVVRASQRALGYREVDYKSRVPGTLAFTQATPTTNGNTISYDYSTQAAKTAQVGFWVDKDVPIIIGPDGNAYITDGHHTTAGYLSTNAPIRQIVPGLNRVILGHIIANYFNPLNPQAPDDTWWTARAAENNAYLYGVNGDALTQPADPNYASLQPILPSVQAMPNTPSAVGAGAMLNSVERSLTWGLADAIVVSATTPAGAKIAGYKKSAPNSSIDINFVEFYWADFLRHRVVWDNSLSGSPFGSPNGDANVTAAPLSFFTAVANGIALARSEAYRDEYGRMISAYTNTALFPQVTVNWANASISNGLAAATDTYNLYLRDDSTIVGVIQPSAIATNILHIDTVAGMTPTQTLQNIRRAVINGGGILQTAWKDATVSNSTLRLPAGTGVVTINGANFVVPNTILGGGTLLVEGTLGGNLQVTNGVLNGHGLINGSLSISGSGNLSPGASIGTITINGPLTLSATTTMEVNKTGAVLTNDLINGITTLTYGGALVLTATGDALTAGDSFKLFDATTYSGVFASLSLPALGGGLFWDTSALNTSGTISVVGSASLPTVATQPASSTNNVGATVTLSGGAVGTQPITYQWQFNSGNLSGQTNTTLSLPNIQESSQGQYRFIANNSAGSVTSATATVTVNQAPSAQAQSVTVQWNTTSNIITLGGNDPDGDSLTFTVLTQPANGTLSGTAPNLFYTPAGNFAGSDSFTFRVSDGSLNSSTATVSITVKRDFTYQDTDLLLVMRKPGFNDLEFNLGSVSNYLGQPNGSTLNVTNFNMPRVAANFGSNLNGVKYALLAVTTGSDPLLRVWLTDSAPGTPTDETFSKWSSQRSKISAVGIHATAYSYPDATNQSLSISPSSPDSYSYIAGTGGSLDVATLSGTVPFPVEQDFGLGVRFFELKVSATIPKPAATQAGHFNVDTNGNVTFIGGIIAPSITAQPVNTSAPCATGSASFSVTADGDEPLSYQWYFGVSPVGGNSSTLNISPTTPADAGSYFVIVSNPAGSVTSSVVTLTVTDTVAPILTVPGNITVTRTSPGGATVNFTATATDNCIASPSVICTPASGGNFSVGSTTVTCIASDGSNSATNSFTVTVQPGFTYQDTDLLLVFRKSGFNDLLFNLGSVSNYLGQPNGAVLNVTNFDMGRVNANFGGNLSGVKYALLGVTSGSDPILRVWLSDSAPGVVLDETFSKWSSQRSKISAVGIHAAAYSFPEATNQSLSIPPSSPDSYTYIAGTGGSLDVATLSGTVPFPVEQDFGLGVRFFEIKVSASIPKPAATQAGHFNVDTNGNVTFTGGFIAPSITGQPVNATAPCATGSASFSVTAGGDEPLSYQWYFGASPVGGNSSTLNISPTTAATAGSYFVIVTNPAGSVTSSVVTLTLTDSIAPVLTVPGNITVTRTSPGGATVNFTATATDNCVASPTVNCTPASGSNFPVGSTTVVCVANDGSNSATNSFIVAVQPGFTYQDTDLLFVLRKSGFNDLLFNLGSVSNYLGQPNGTMFNVTNFDMARIAATFGGSLNGVKYALLSVTSGSDSPLRVWLSDSAPGVVLDETFSKWSSQRSKISAVGIHAAAYSFPDATNQSLSLPPSSPDSYTYIAGTGGSLDVATLSGTVPFPVEQDVTNTVRFFEIKVSGINPKPAALQVGNFTVDGSGNLTFAANKVPVANDDGATTLLNTPLNIAAATLLANDTDPDGDTLTVQSVSATSTNGGTVSLSLGTITYTPVNGFTGTDRFSYTINDGRTGTATANVYVFVSSTPLPAPNHVSINPVGNGFRVVFNGVPGQSYRVQRTTNLNPTIVWTDLTTVTAPPHGIIEYIDTNPPQPQAFYQLVHP